MPQRVLCLNRKTGHSDDIFHACSKWSSDSKTFQLSGSPNLAFASMTGFIDFMTVNFYHGVNPFYRLDVHLCVI